MSEVSGPYVGPHYTESCHMANYYFAGPSRPFLPSKILSFKLHSHRQFLQTLHFSPLPSSKGSSSTTMQPCADDASDDPDNLSFTSTTTVTNAQELKRSASSGSEATTWTSTTTISSTTSSSTTTAKQQHAPPCKDQYWHAIHRATSTNPNALTLSDLRLVHRLGSGDIGSVYLVELKHAATGCLFAAKVMDKKELVSRNKENRARIEREILEMIDHPFLPTLYATLDCPRWSCLLTEFCPGGDLHVLRQRQPEKRFSESAVRCVLVK